MLFIIYFYGLAKSENNVDCVPIIMYIESW
jgi:hypothetical protein